MFEIWKHLDEVARTETPKQGLWLDSSDMSAAVSSHQLGQFRFEGHISCTLSISMRVSPLPIVGNKAFCLRNSAAAIR